MVRSLDLSIYEDFCQFVTAQHQALASLNNAVGESVPLLARRLNRARQDMLTLGCTTDSLPVPAPSEIAASPIGLRYVVSGAALGSKALSGLKSRSRDVRVLEACQLTEDDTLLAEWRMLVPELLQFPGEGTVAEEAVSTAKACFRVFEDAFRVIIPRNPSVDART